MTVAKNVEYGLKIRGVSKARRAERVADMLDLIEMADLGSRYPRQLSGGQRQRVALARALAFEPSLLLLDEPFASLDVRLREQLREDIRDLQRRTGVTALLVTHDQTDAFDLADRMALLHAGVIRQSGAPRELYEKPASQFVAEFLGGASILPGIIANRSEGRVVEMPGGVALAAPEATPGMRVGVVVRPNMLSISTSGDTAPQYYLKGRIVDRRYMEGMIRYRVDTAGVYVSVFSSVSTAEVDIGDAVMLDCGGRPLHTMKIGEDAG
jgi:spermidine/putrescine transport system ATP-binding protein